MARRLILETTYLIDLEREVRSGRDDGPARAALRRHADDSLFITFTVAGELACGSSLSSRERWETFVAPFQVLEATADVCWEYGKAYRHLRDNGCLIGANDLWIAATALASDMPVMTRNEAHYRRVPGLRVQEYGR